MASTIILITGANSGVGFATSKVITNASDAFHVIMAGRSLAKVENAMSEIKSADTKGHLSTVQLDVTDEKSIEKAVAHVESKFGRLDVLVNNAGIASRDPDIKTRIQLCMNTNVVGPAMVSEAFRPLLLKSEKPYSIYVSSGVGSLAQAADPASETYHGPSNGEGYRASKSALNMIALQESAVFESTALNVFAVCPGFVRSNLRGESEEARNGWGKAGDPKVSGETILSVIRGQRDADAGKFVHSNGIFPW